VSISQGGIYKSVDGGMSWSLALKVDDAYSHGYDFVVAAGAVVYAGISRDLYKSDDYGETWRKVYEMIDFACAIDPTSTDIVYVGAENGVAKTTDGGQTWTRHRFPENGGLTVYTIAINPITPTIVYAGGSTHNNGTKAYKSTDGGVSWEALEILGGFFCKRIVIDPERPSTIYYGCWDGIYKSTDGGASWQKLGMGSGLILSLDPSDSQIVYAGGHEVGLARSLDGGLTWEEVIDGQTIYHPRSFAIDPRSPDTLYLGNPFGIYKSADGGDSWEKASKGISAITIDALAVVPSGTLFASCLDSQEVFRGKGADWTVVMSHRKIEALAVNPLDPDVVYAGCDEALYRSLDGGSTWEQIYSVGSIIGLDPTVPTSVYVGGVIEGQWRIARSLDGGQSWISSPLPDCIEINAIAVDALQPEVIYVVGQNGEWAGAVWKSLDSGLSWQTMPARFWHVSAVVVDQKNPDTVFAGGYGGIYKSTDGGVTWWQAVCGECQGYCLVFDPLLPNTLYAGGGGNKVHKTQDGGATWSLLPGRLGGALRALVIYPGFPKTIYAGVTGDGVWSFTGCCIYLPLVIKDQRQGLITMWWRELPSSFP